MKTLEQRIQGLEDIEAIKQLKYRYWRCLDLKLWDEMASCFTPDARVTYGEGRYSFDGVDAIVKFLRESLSKERGSVSVHHGHHPEIRVTSDTTAEATWALYNYMYNQAEDRGIRIGAYYHDVCVRVGGEWKFTSIGYTYIFHEEWKRSADPSLRVVAQQS